MVKIMLDPGHGGGRAHNRGFVNVPNWPYCNEGDNNFIYARDYLKPALERAGFVVGMTKNTIGPNPSLQARGAKAKGWDMLISLHTNAAGGKATGVEIWDSTNPKEKSIDLCNSLCSAMAKAIGTNNRGTKYKKSKSGSNFYGILRHGLGKKNFIIEHVFHDNFQDAKKYVNNLKETAEATTNVLASYYGLSKQPMPVEDITPADTEQDFIQAVWADIKNTKLRILPSVTIAQAILESAWGKSELAMLAKNLFGIKAGKDWAGQTYAKMTNEQDSNGNTYRIKADFRKYKSYKESVLDHDNFFVSTEWRKKNYAPVLEAKEYKTQCQALQACGYATDKQYASKLISIIERNALQLFDKGVEAVVQAKDINVVPEWAEKEWKEAQDLGITDGTRPSDTATRVEVAAMLVRALKANKEGKDEQHDSTNSNGAGYSTGL